MGPVVERVGTSRGLVESQQTPHIPSLLEQGEQGELLLQLVQLLVVILPSLRQSLLVEGVEVEGTIVFRLQRVALVAVAKVETTGGIFKGQGL